VLNKVDLPDVAKAHKRLGAVFARRKIRLLAISAATGAGIDALLEEAWRVIVAERVRQATKLSTTDSTIEAGAPPEEDPGLTPRARPVRGASRARSGKAARPREH